MSLDALVASMGHVTGALDAALEARDPSTHHHSTRVIHLSSCLGKACGLSARELQVLDVCARFHDIGKIGIPDQILHKPGKLSRDEYTIIQQHTTIGAKLIRRIDVPGIHHFADIVQHHHERFDGKGYPAGLSGEAIPLLSRLISVVDSFDAITTHRHYHQANSSEVALEIIASERGAQFDPEVSDQFLAIAETELARCRA